MSEKKGKCIMSKTKYHEIKEAFSREFDESHVSKLMSILQEVMQFDPTLSTYDEKQAMHIRNYRQRQRAMKTTSVDCA